MATKVTSISKEDTFLKSNFLSDDPYKNHALIAIKQETNAHPHALKRKAPICKAPNPS